MDTTAYLERIGYDLSREPTAETLRALHRAHLYAVPFENLDVIAGRPITLDMDAVFEKVVRQRRGGFCYELNGLFAALLRSLGFRVDLLSARVVCADGSFGPPFDHLALAVQLEEPCLADVGVGHSFRDPLRLRPGEEQAQPEGVFRLVEAGEEWLYQEREADGSWYSHYYLSLQPRRLEDFAAMCSFHQSSPDSPFTKRLLCSLATPEGRLTVAGNRWIRTVLGERTEREFQGEADLAAILAIHFGISRPATG